ncbi:MAG: hypothetical protein ABIJ09_15830 [Pseudomonadota bacterium]
MLHIEGGNSFFDEAASPGDNGVLALARARVIASALHRAELDALVPGPGDLGLGLARFDELVRAYKLPVVASNLVRVADRRPAYQSHVVRQLGGQRIVVVSALDPANWPPATGLDPTPALPALRGVLAKVARPGDHVVLVARMSSDAAARLAQGLPQVSVVLVAQRGLVSFLPREEARPGQHPERDGSSVPVVAAGQQGHYLVQFEVWAVRGDATWRGGAVTEDARERRELAVQRLVRRPEDAQARAEQAETAAWLERQRGKTRYRYRLLELDARLPDDPEVAAQRAALQP